MDRNGKQHERNPFHRVEKWTNNLYYSPAWLADAGVVLQLGHGGGECPSHRQYTSGDSWEDEDNWTSDEEDDNDIEATAAAHSRSADGSRPAAATYTGNQTVMVIVDTTGIHRIPVWWCGCEGAPSEEMQLLDMALYPASHRRVKSCFTFRVLDDFLLDNLDTFPDQVPNRYQELLRVSRQWGHMKDMMRHGFGYPGRARPGPGDLTFFCAACPQPGVNLPPEWKEDENQLIYTRGFMMDGNSSAEHLKMRRPANDVAISDGTGFMVGEGRYKAHLKVAKEVKSKSSCNNHKAVNLANADRHKLEATGIGATACPRHGCFLPHAVVDFQKGERQMNMDYSFSQALGRNMENIQRVILLYDINCQYGVHLRQRFTESPYLHMPRRLEIVQGIGLFHVHGHQDACFMRYSPTFIPGAGLVDGEILETLWSSLNKVSGSTRGMATSHRKEVLNRHMNDWNWKKMINIGKQMSIAADILLIHHAIQLPCCRPTAVTAVCLIAIDAAVDGTLHDLRSVPALRKKYTANLPLMEDVTTSYNAMVASADPEMIQAWTVQMEEAQWKQLTDVKAMDVFDIRTDRAPSRANIQLSLTDKETQHGLQRGTIAWLSQGIKVQEAVSLAAHVRSLPKSPTTEQKIDLLNRRKRLQTRVDAHEGKKSRYIVIEDNDEDDNEKDVDDNLGEEWDAVEPDDVFWAAPARASGNAIRLAERVAITLPSTLGHARCEALNIQQLAAQELKLREGQANDTLHQIRICLGQKSFLFRTSIRSAHSQHNKTRAWGDVNAVDRTLQHHTRVYSKAQKAMVSLGAPEHF
ncbi:hypothetical protein B0H21DRAFT_820230 [Amylocystis lapponica]|nr:hypothetical protein B0H21DRAFT_820230 [Amylocystis lapponica]